MNLLLRNLRLVSPSDELDTVTDVLIVKGIIQKIGRVTRIPKDTEELNLKGKNRSTGLV